MAVVVRRRGKMEIAENWSLLVVDVFGRYCSCPLFADDSDVVNLVMSAMA